ncbi:MAG TPA: endonuclease/exonuclease/phosphatase family protein, partial [Nocardioidaceae bacterium]|nr:endonuclease/exonuclease/phosphatase family protein [Nocardioidaceae bacterium]
GDDYNLRTGDFCAVPNGCPLALHHLAHIIRASGADVVGVQEAERSTAKLARLVGGWYASPRAHVISRFPILDPPHSRGNYVFIEPTPGRVVAMANTHLPSTPYGPYKAQKGWSRQQVLRLERTLRLPAIEKTIHALKPLAAKGIPVVLTGDFNSPSYRDWTPAAAHERPLVPYSVTWPASKALADAGFVDSYREVYPSPVKHPGFTWSPGGPETRKHDFPDRIDWVLHAGPAKAISSEVLGEKGNPNVDLGFGPPYPTDHRGVVSTLRVKAAPAPNLVSPSTRRPTIGEPLDVAFHAPAGPGHKVALVTKDGGRLHVVRAEPTRGATNGTVTFGTRGLKPTKYGVALLGPDKHVLSMQPVWAYPPHTRATVTTKRSYRVGAPISVSWTRAPGMALDWISVFRCQHGKCDPTSGYLTYDYTHTRIEGTLRISRHDAQVEGSDWPLPPGKYIARLLVDDGYVVAGRSKRFSIVE